MKGAARLLALFTVAAMFISVTSRQAIPAPLRILFTAETRGNLEPCDCPGLPLGGLARRVGFMQRAALSGPFDGSSSGAHEERKGLDHPGIHAGIRFDQTDTLLLRLDIGGFLPEGQVHLADRPGIAQRYVSLLLRGLESSGMDTGVLDYQMRAFLEEITPSAFAPIASRFLEADPPNQAHLVDWDGSTVAILALDESLHDSVVVAAASGALKAAGPDGYLFVLGRADGFSGRRLARLTGADLVILSRGARFPRPLIEGSSILVACGSQGMEVGDLLLFKTDEVDDIISIQDDPAARRSNASSRHERLREEESSQIRAADGRLVAVNWTLHPMDNHVSGNEGTAREVRALLREAGAGLDQVQRITTE